MEEEFTVSRLSALIKRSLELNFDRIKLTAEISGLKIHSSGHAYFSLKDESAVIDAICWKGTLLKHSSQQLSNGMKVTCFGKVSSYPMQSKYQFIVDKFEPAGLGNLLKMLEERKKKLAAEGLFNVEYKKPIPKIPNIIGVITSPTGAVIRDILHRLRQRFPRDVLLWPILVQGNEAAKQIEEALNGMNALQAPRRPDVLIVARGGGSFEDLMPFNEENVVRAVFRSEIPVISAIGHETDTTLIDYVADLRAPTPTAAAEFAVPERIQLQYAVNRLSMQLASGISNILDKNRIYLKSSRTLDIRGMISEKIQSLDLLTERLNRSISDILNRKKISLSGVAVAKPVLKFNLDQLKEKLEFAFIAQMKNASHRLNLAANNLESCSYINILRKGFVLAQTTKHQIISTKEEALQQSEFHLIFIDGVLKVSAKPQQIDLF